ncbi:MAG: hypothetical protein FWE07_03175 [Turicibacter sp.]|nr:hypothetical protein [Turicibacter sp.]
MRNTTEQLFDYLLAAKKNYLPVNRSLNEYSSHWFLDEILSSGKSRLVSATNGESPHIDIHRSVYEPEKIETSSTLATVFELLSYDPETGETLEVEIEDVEEILSLESRSLDQKIYTKEKDTIILNDWQQLLLGVSTPKVKKNVAIRNSKQQKNMTTLLINELKAWKEAKRKQAYEKAQAKKAAIFYDDVINIKDEDGKLYLGVGILNVPYEQAVYHPVLTIEMNIEVNDTEGVCHLTLADAPLSFDGVLNHFFANKPRLIHDLQQALAQQNVTAFDDEKIAEIFKSFILQIHPEGQYLASPHEAVDYQGVVPQLMHRSVLFVRKDSDDPVIQRLKATLDHYENDPTSSDVLGKMIDPNYAEKHTHVLDTSTDMMQASPVSMTPSETSILQLIKDHSAVAVFEDQANKYPVMANLLTHFIANGKRVLVFAEELSEIEEVRSWLPTYLAGLHTVVSSKSETLPTTLEDLKKWRKEKADDERLTYDFAKTASDIEKSLALAAEIKAQILDYRELSSKKVFWQEKRYFPYELAQLVSKIGGFERFSGDKIPMEAKFEMKNADIERLWGLKSAFTPENMALLNYEFIDLDELVADAGYQKLLATEEKYLRLCREYKNLENMFGKEIDLRFIQYLYDQLPRIMKEVDDLTDPYAKLILREAMESLDGYHSLAASVDRITQGVEEIPQLDRALKQRDALIEKLNHLLRIEKTELLMILNGTLDGHDLHEFYLNKKASMTKALQIAHLIWIFNEGAFALSKDFRGVSAEGLDIMSILYHAAALHLSKAEVEASWQRVRAHFMKTYVLQVQTEHIHPVCLDLFETMKNGQFTEFKKVLEEVNEKVTQRHHFITFGNFISEINATMPMLTAELMSNLDNEIEETPDLKAEFEQGKLNLLLSQLKEFEDDMLERKLLYLESQKLELHHEWLENKCWQNETMVDEAVVADCVSTLTESLNRQGLRRLLSVFPVSFVALNDTAVLQEISANQFDVAFFADASSSSVFRLPELMHTHKAILFGTDKEVETKKDFVVNIDASRLNGTYSKALHNFGEQYLGASLFELISHSAAWDSRMKLAAKPAPLKKHVASNVKAGVKVCDNAVEEEIFDELTRAGYELKCKVKTGELVWDFLIEADKQALVINIIGDEQTHPEVIKKQLDQELILKNQGLNIYNLNAPNYYLNPRESLKKLYLKLEELNIYPQNDR